VYIHISRRSDILNIVIADDGNGNGNDSTGMGGNANNNSHCRTPLPPMFPNSGTWGEYCRMLPVSDCRQASYASFDMTDEVMPTLDKHYNNQQCHITLVKRYIHTRPHSDHTLRLPSVLIPITFS